MFVMIATYFVIITQVFRKNHIKNQTILLMMIIMMMMVMDMETIPISSLMLNWRCKIHNTQKQSGTSFHHIFKEPNQIIWSKDWNIK